jgi:hypothetical protein
MGYFGGGTRMIMDFNGNLKSSAGVSFLCVFFEKDQSSIIVFCSSQKSAKPFWASTMVAFCDLCTIKKVNSEGHLDVLYYSITGLPR